ncbi:MAG TPA: acyltransferase [Cyclobacteriaceae bacterium]|nr:acyltransferase [Cyclobacteriaceae bacterium]
MKSLIKKILLRIFDWALEETKRNRYNQFRKLYEIDKEFKFNGPGILFYGDGKIILGPRSYIGNFSTIQSEKGCEVVIGSHCAISHYVKIYTSSYLADQDFTVDRRTIKSGSVIIGDGVWIGANVLINPGVTIGSNSIIGANSVVTKDVESNSIVSGVPAIFVRYKKMNEQSI